MRDQLRELVEEHTGLPIAPLIDVVFLLLIYFMITSSLKKQEADLGIQLPGSVAQTQTVQIPDEQIIEVMADNRIVLNSRVFAADSGHDIPELFATLVRYRLAATAARSKALVTIQAEDDVAHERVIDVMNACNAAGIKHVTFGMGE
jgi:biopolymer transport protein ExbD